MCDIKITQSILSNKKLSTSVDNERAGLLVNFLWLLFGGVSFKAQI